jgi:outer membrane protein
VTAYLKKFAAEKDLHFVLKFDVSSDVLYAGDALDVSQDVIQGLNSEYEQEKSGAKAAVKKDTTSTKK